MTIVNQLSRALPKGIVLTSNENTRPFECDGLSIYRQKPLAVVLPDDVMQIKQVLKICKINNIPVVTRGAGTGLSGGAMPLEKSIVLGLSKLNKVKLIDVENQLAVVEPGVRNIAISEAVTQHGLYYAPDPSSQIACTIGGNVSENSGGVHCLKYGLTVHNVEAIRMLTIDGDELILSCQDDGLGLLALMNGSEGLLGVITEVTVKLTPNPAFVKMVMAGFDSVRDCADAITNIIKAGIIPAGLEMMDSFAIKAAEGFVQVGYPLDAKALLLCELDGIQTQVQLELDNVLKILSGASTLKVSESEEERLNFWKGRKSAFSALGTLSPDYYCMDGTIPRRHLADMLEKIHKLSNKYQLRVANVFHAGDGNLHPLILYDANVIGELERTEEFGTEILKLSVDMGGTITGEHGVGVEKLNAMCYQFNMQELEIFHKIKQVFDENLLLNPGKAVPELHRCAELGAMHVHHGELAHPELERFLMDSRLQQLQTLVKESSSLHIKSTLLDYSGIVEYYAEDLVISVKAGTSIAQIKKQLKKNNQVLSFYTDNDNISIGAAYAQGAQDLSDCVLGVKIIDGTGAYLNFGGQVIKNVAGYDVARLLVGSKGKLALIMQISFKIMPATYVNQLTPPVKCKNNSVLHQQIEKKLKQVFDPRGIFN